MSTPQHWSQRPLHNTAQRIITGFWRKPIQYRGSSCSLYTKLNYIKFTFKLLKPSPSKYCTSCIMSLVISQKAIPLRQIREAGTMMAEAIVFSIDSAAPRPSKHAWHSNWANKMHGFLSSFFSHNFQPWIYIFSGVISDTCLVYPWNRSTRICIHSHEWY